MLLFLLSLCQEILINSLQSAVTCEIFEICQTYAIGIILVSLLLTFNKLHKVGANRSNMSYNMLYTMLKVGCWDSLNMI